MLACPSCHMPVSDTATVCPYCGQDNPRMGKGLQAVNSILHLILAAALLAIFFAVIFSVC